MPKLKQSFLTIVIGLALIGGLSYAWTGPTANPPENNASAPINVSVLGQIKAGALQVNGFRNVGNSIFDGLATFNSSIKIPTGAGAGKVLTSDASGNASWGNAGGGIGGSGTANYVSKWTNSTTLGNSQIFDNGTNIGIGTNDPKAKLDILGNIKITDGTQGSGKVLTSDANGVASWTNGGYEVKIAAGGSLGETKASCSASKKILGGGCRVFSEDYGIDIPVSGSYPLIAGESDPWNPWKSIEKNDGWMCVTSANYVTVRAYAICAD